MCRVPDRLFGHSATVYNEDERKPYNDMKLLLALLLAAIMFMVLVNLIVAALAALLEFLVPVLGVAAVIVAILYEEDEILPSDEDYEEEEIF